MGQQDTEMPDDLGGDGYLTGQLLIAMPNMPDSRFEKSVIYVCAHSAEGAMGLMINREMDNLTFPELLEQLEIPVSADADEIRVHFGGPVESGRGFVLHSTDYNQEGTMLVDNGLALTATVEILRSIVSGDGPRHHLLALGYAGWGPGQLDSEIQSNGWLHAPASEAFVFGRRLDSMWEKAIGLLGIDPIMLSGDAGHA